MTTVYGIDPGSQGACAERTADGIYVIRFIRRRKISVIGEFANRSALAKLNGPIYGFKENMGPRPGEGVNSVFTSGKNHGFAEDLLEFNKIEYELIDARTWQYEYGLGGKFATDSERKNAHREVACKLFNRQFTLDEADAALIADYGWRKVHGLLTGGKDGKQRKMPEVPRDADGKRVWNYVRERLR